MLRELTVPMTSLNVPGRLRPKTHCNRKSRDRIVPQADPGATAGMQLDNRLDFLGSLPSARSESDQAFDHLRAHP